MDANGKLPRASLDWAGCSTRIAGIHRTLVQRAEDAAVGANGLGVRLPRARRLARRAGSQPLGSVRAARRSDIGSTSASRHEDDRDGSRCKGSHVPKVPPRATAVVRYQVGPTALRAGLDRRPLPPLGRQSGDYSTDRLTRHLESDGDAPDGSSLGVQDHDALDVDAVESPRRLSRGTEDHGPVGAPRPMPPTGGPKYTTAHPPSVRGDLPVDSAPAPEEVYGTERRPWGKGDGSVSPRGPSATRAFQ